MKDNELALSEEKANSTWLPITTYWKLASEKVAVVMTKRAAPTRPLVPGG